MFNSVPVLLATLAFILFGYVSLVRILSKMQFGESWREALQNPFADGRLFLQSIGRSALFIALPGVSLLLFWGWGPALLWLVIFHLLVETILNIHLAGNLRDRRNRASLTQSLSTGTGPAAISFRLSWQLLMILLCALLLTQLAGMLDQTSGLFWSLLALLPAAAILNNKNPLVPYGLKQAVAAAIFTFGLIMADSLGIVVHGNWSLSGNSFDWLVLNNATILALAVLIATALLAGKKSFNDSLATLAGYLWLVLIVSLLLVLAWMRPELDAPLHSSQVRSESLPLFVAVALIMFAGLLSIFMRWIAHDPMTVQLADRQNSDNASQSAVSVQHAFSRQQSLSLLQLIFALLLILALAAALGIGAWSSHYLEWSEQASVLRHFELALAALFDLATRQANIGSLAHTVFMSGACFIGLSALMFCFSRLQAGSVNAKPAANLWELVVHKKLVQAGLIYLLVCYFLNYGITLNLWILAGVLAWFLVTQIVLQVALDKTDSGSTARTKQSDRPQPSLSTQIYTALSLLLLVGGLAQTVMVAMRWFQQGSIVLAILISLLLLLCLVLWASPLKRLVLSFQPIERAPPLEPLE